MRALIYLLFFASGISGLVYEIVWMRKLALIFGNTAYATSAVLSAFMGGLALGSFLFGRLVDRWRNPLRLYGSLEVAIAASTLVIMILLLPIMDAAYVSAFRFLPGTGPGIVAVRFALAFLCLIVPTTLMGGTLPVLSRFFVRRAGTLGLEVGNLYAINTVGAAVGCFLTGFVLIRLLGETTTVAIALALNLGVGVVTLALASRMRDSDPEAAVMPPATGPAGAAPEPRLSGRVRAVLGGFALVGAASLAYEVIWTRMLINVIGSDVYCFTLILTVFLLGITLGSVVMARFADRLRHPLLTFGLCEVALGCLALATIPLIDALPRISTAIVAPLTEKGLAESPFAQRSFGMFGLAFLVFLGPTVLMGAVFPVVNRIYHEHVRRVGRIVGDVYSVNTVGTIVGAAAAGFVILPAFGIAGSIVAVSFLNLGVGLVLCALVPRSRFTVGAGLAGGAAAAGCLAFIFGRGLEGGVPGYVERGRTASIPYYRETPAATLYVREDTRDRNVWGRPLRQLVINHHPTAHNVLPDMIVHKMLAHVPLLFHQHPARALVVGFGLGSTSYSMLQHADVRVDCVELLAEERETAPFFEVENGGILESRPDRFELIVNDGRNYILATETTYDVISVNAIDPRLSPAIYTRDFFALCRAKMTDDGVIGLWLPTYSISNVAMLSIYKSFQDVFPQSFVLYNNPSHFLLIGSATPIRIDLERFRARTAVPQVRESLGLVCLDDPLVLLSTVILTPDGLKEMLRGVPLNTDANPIVEFDQRRVAGQLNVNPEFFRGVLRHHGDILPYLTETSRAGEDARRIERYSRQLAAWMEGQLEYHSGARASGMNRIVAALGLEENPFLEASLTTRGRRLANDPILEPHREILVETYEKVLAARPEMVHIHHYLALAAVGRGDFAQAVAHGRDAVRLRPDDWFYSFYLGNWLVQLGDLAAAREHFERLRETESGRAAGTCGLGIVLARQGRLRAARERLEEALREDPHFLEARRLLRRVRQGLASPAGARGDGEPEASGAATR